MNLQEYLRRNAIPAHLVLSYASDWLVLTVMGILGYAFSSMSPSPRAFSLSDPDLSYPQTSEETIPLGLTVVLALIVPAVIIVLVVVAHIPGPTVERGAPKSVLWKTKLWECNVGLLGLALAAAGAYTTAKALKTLYGKPRPDLLARCDPDITKVAEYAVGGLGLNLPGAPVMVSWKICKNKSYALRVVGFVSFPSDHSSMAFSGMTYISLWLCSKFSITFPYLAATQNERDEDQTPAGPRTSSRTEQQFLQFLYVRDEAAAPPLYLFMVAAIPIAVATYIAASRWFDHRHHGFDILFGSALGLFFGWFGYRLYNLPIRRGAGWAWGPRSRKHAFFKGVGYPSYNGGDNWASERDENGRVALA